MLDTFSRWAWLALLLVAAVVSASLAWARLVHHTQPEVVLRIMPWHPDALLATAERTRLDGDGSTREVADLGKQILRTAPMLDAPLVFSGLDRASRGDGEGAVEAFRLASRRQPRNVPALAWLASSALQDGSFDEGARLLNQLWRVDPDNRKLYAEVMATFAFRPEGVAILEDELRQASPLALGAVEKLIPTLDDMNVLMRLATQAPAFQRRVVDRLAREQGLEQAFIAWLSFLPSSEARGLSWPYDPAFVGSEAPPPFNWELLSEAERLEEGGLLVRYSGRGSTVFARQAMVLGPGSYRLAAQMDGDLSGTGGQLVWQVKCVPDDHVIGFERVLSSSSMLSTQTLRFSVPPTGCNVQQLSLEGRAGPFPTRVRATVRHVAIRPADAGAP